TVGRPCHIPGLRAIPVHGCIGYCPSTARHQGSYAGRHKPCPAARRRSVPRCAPESYRRTMTALAGTFAIGSDSGDRLAIRTSRQGLAARVGHDLTIEATKWSGEVVADPDDPGRSTVRADIELNSLHVREGLGGKLPLADHERDEIDDNIRRILNRATATYV